LQILIIVHNPPYGSERTYHALRLADALLKVEDDLDLTLYLTADGVLCAKKGQQTPQGYYNVERMLKPILTKGSVMACHSCLEARGISRAELTEGVLETRLGDLAQLVLEADKVLIY